MIDNLVNRLRIKAGVIENCEPIAWGSDTSLMREAADRIEELEAKIEVLRLIALAYRYNKEMGDKLCEELGVDLGRQTNE